MRIKVYKHMIAMSAAVSVLIGTGALTTFPGEEGSGQNGSKQALIQTEDHQTETQTEPVRISWWICPMGGYADEEKVEALTDAFEKAHPDIEVDFRILDERTGEAVIDEALSGRNGSDDGSGKDSSDEKTGSDDMADTPDGKSDEKTGSDDMADTPDGKSGEDTAIENIDSDDMKDVPDVIMASPEYIVTKCGREGSMADLTQLWDEETQREFRSEMRDVSKGRDDVFYAVPLFRDPYTMALNYDMFEKAGAIQYLNEEAHSWKDSGFIDSVLRVHDVLVQEAENGSEEEGIVGKVYCADQIGQRAFRCFVTNFFKTGLVDDYRSSYQIGKGKIRDVFGTLRKLVGKGIEFDKEMNGDDENEAFLNGDLFMTFNWNAAKQRAAVSANETRFRIFPMMYPNSKNVPTLTGPIGALGVVETKEEKTKDAAVSFVRYLMSDEDTYRQAVLTAGCFPARRSINGHGLTGLYGEDETMMLYETLNEYYEEYEPMMELYPQLEEAWPALLCEIADGAKIKSVTTDLEEELNGRLEEEYGIRKIEMEEEA